MTYIDPERTTPRLKVATSRFVLLDSLSTNPLPAEINWHDVIPDEDDTFFYGSLNAQIYFFKQHCSRFAQVRTLAALFHMSHASYYLMFPACARVTESLVLSAPPPRLGRPHLVPPELEQILVDRVLEQQQMGDCFSPKECCAFLGDCLSSDARTVNLDRHWWHRFLQRTPVLAVRRCDGASRSEKGGFHIIVHII
jgi:hypothetical protein